MRETSRSLDAIIIIFITIHPTVKVIKYTDIRNFIDDAFLYFILSHVDVLGEIDNPLFRLSRM